MYIINNEVIFHSFSRIQLIFFIDLLHYIYHLVSVVYTIYISKKTNVNFLLKPLGMAGKSNTDQLLVDQIVDTVNDLINEMIKPVFEKDEARKVDNIVYIGSCD